MEKRVLTEPLRALTALHAAAYMRWVETRKGVSPSPTDTQKFVQCLLDSEGFTYEPDEPQIIEILALASNIDLVHDFIKRNDIFEKLDQSAKVDTSN
jgi:hypothetical protein